MHAKHAWASPDAVYSGCAADLCAFLAPLFPSPQRLGPAHVRRPAMSWHRPRLTADSPAAPPASLTSLSQHPNDDGDEVYADEWDAQSQHSNDQFEQAQATDSVAPAAAVAHRNDHSSSNGHRHPNAASASTSHPFVSSTLSGSSYPLERLSDGMRTLQSTAQLQQQNDALSHAYATMHPASSTSASSDAAPAPAPSHDFLAEHAAARSSKLAALNLHTHMSETLIARVARAAALNASKHTGTAVPETPLHALQELDLSRLGAGQKIKSLSALECVPRLTKLVLNHQLLESLHPGLQALHHLRILSVEHNQLTRLEGIWHLAHSLEELHLGHNHLERLPKRMGEMTRLTVLRLHANKLGEIGSTVSALTGCTNLTSLTLFANPLAELGSMRGQVLAALPALETLDAQGIDTEERAEARDRFGGAKETSSAKEALLAAQQALSAVQRRNTELENSLAAAEKREQSLRRKLESTETDLARSSSLAAKLDRELNERIHAVQELQAQLQQVQQQFEFYRIDHEGGGGGASATPNAGLLRSPSPASASPQPAGLSFMGSPPQTDRRNAAEWNRTGSHPPSPSRTRFATPASSPSKLVLDGARGSPMFPASAPVVVLPVPEAVKTDRAEIQMLDLLLSAAGLSLDRRAQRVAAKRADARALQAQHAKVRAQMEAFNASSGDAATVAASPPPRRPSLLSSPAASAALDAECQELQHQIDALAAELTGLNSALQSTTSSAERAEIQHARSDVEESLAAARSELSLKHRQQQRAAAHGQEDSSGLDRAAMGSTDDLDDLDSGSQSFRAASLSAQVAQLPDLLLKLEAAEKALHADVASDSSRVIALNKRASTWSIRREYLTNQLAAQKAEWTKQREALAAPLPSDPAARSALLDSFSLEFDAQTHVDPDTLVSATLVPQMLQLEESLCAAEAEVERAQGELEVAKTQMAATTRTRNGEPVRSPSRGGGTAATALASGGYHFSPRIDSTGDLHLLEQNELLTALSSLQLDNTELRVALDKSVDSIEALKRNKKELKDALRALERSAQSTPNPSQSPQPSPPAPQDLEKLARAEKRIDSLLGELTALKGEYARSQEEIAALQQDLADALAQSRKAVQASPTSAPKSVSSGANSPPNALAALQSMVDDYERDIPLLQSEKERLAAELAQSQDQLRELQRERSRTVPLEEKERLVAELTASENRLRDLQAQRGALASAEKDRLLAELAQSERRAESLQREKDALRDQLREAHRVAEAAAATAALAAEAPQPPRTPSPPPEVRDSPSPSVQAQADSARVAELEAMFSAERRRALGELESMAAALKAKETEAQRAEESATRAREQQEAHEAILRQREALATQQQQLHEQQQRAYELAQAQLTKQQQELAAMEARQAQQLASQRELSAQQHSELQAQQLAQRDLLSEAIRSLTSRLAELQDREKELQELLDSKVVEIADLEALLQEKRREMGRTEAATAAAKEAGDRAVQEAAQKVASLNAEVGAAASARPSASASASAKASPPTSNPASARSTKHASNTAAAASRSAAATPASALSPALSVSSAAPPSELQALALAGADPALHSLESEIAAQTLVLQNLQDAVAQTQTELDTRRRIGAEIAAMEKALAESVEEEKQRARALLAEETSQLLTLRQSKFELDRALDQSLADLSAITERHRALADQVTKLEALRTQAKEEAKSRRASESAEKADRARAVEASRQELSDVRAQVLMVRADLEALEKARAAAEANLASLRDQTAAARSQLDTLAGAHVSARAQVDSESAALGSQVTDARRELNEVLGQLARALEQMAETSKDLSDLSAQKRNQMSLWDEREREWRATQQAREQERSDHEQLVVAIQDNIRKHEEHLAALAREVQQRHQELENVSAQQQQQPPRSAAGSDDAQDEPASRQFTCSGASNPKRSMNDSASASPLNHTIPDSLGAFASPTQSRSINMREQQAKYSKTAPLSPKPKGGAGGSSTLKGHREAFCATSAMEDGFVPPPPPVRNEEVHARAVEASAARAQARRDAESEEVAAKLASEAHEELNARRAKKREPFSSTGPPPRGFTASPTSPIRAEMLAKRAAEVAASRAEAGASFEQSAAALDALDAQVAQLQKQIRQLGGEKRALKSDLRLFAEECAAARAFMAQELAADQSAIAESKAQVARAKVYVSDIMPLVDVGRSQALARLDERLENHDLSPEEREIQAHARIHAHQPPLDQAQQPYDLSSPAASPSNPRRAKAPTEVDAVLLRTPSGRAATRSREATTQKRSHSIPASPSGSGSGVGFGRSASLSPPAHGAAASSAASSPAAVSGSPGQHEAQLDYVDVRAEQEAVQDLRHEKALLKRAVKDLHRELASAMESAQQEGLALQAHSTELRAACTESESRLKTLRAQIAAAEGAWRDVQDRIASMPGSIIPPAPLASATAVASPRSSRSSSVQKTTTSKRVSGKYYLTSPALPLSSPDGLKRKLHSPSRSSRVAHAEESKQAEDEHDESKPAASASSQVAAALTPLEISQLQQHNRELLRLHTELLGHLRLRGGEVPRNTLTDPPASIASLLSSVPAAGISSADDGPTSLLPQNAFLSLQDLFLLKEAHWSSTLASLREEIVKRDQEQAVLLRDLEGRVHRDENSIAARIADLETQMRNLVEVVERERMQAANSQLRLMAGGESSAFASPVQMHQQPQSTASAFSSPSLFARASSSSLTGALNSDLLALFTQLRSLVASLAQSMHGFEVQLTSLHLHRTSRSSFGESPMLNIDVSQALRERDSYILFLLENLRDQGRISVAKLLPGLEPHWVSSLQQQAQAQQNPSTAIVHLNTAGKLSLLEQVRREFKAEESKNPSSTQPAILTHQQLLPKNGANGAPLLISVSQSVSPVPSHQRPSAIATAHPSSSAALAPPDLYAQIAAARSRPFAGLPQASAVPASSPSAAAAVSKTLRFDDADGDELPQRRAATKVEAQPEEVDAAATGTAEARTQPQPSPLAGSNPAPLTSATPTTAPSRYGGGAVASAPHSAAAAPFRLR